MSNLFRDQRAKCPNVANHTEGPDGYTEWVAWAAKMDKTHRQLRCKDCDFYVIWEPLEEPAAVES